MNRASSVDFPTPPCPEMEMILCVGSAGLRMFCTKKRSSPVRPIKRLRASVGDCEPRESFFLTKGICLHPPLKRVVRRDLVLAFHSATVEVRSCVLCEEQIDSLPCI